MTIINDIQNSALNNESCLCVCVCNDNNSCFDCHCSPSSNVIGQCELFVIVPFRLNIGIELRKMNNCTVCDDHLRNDRPNKVICDGICRQVFHAECVNFNKDALSYYREMPNLQWFCDNCIVQTSTSNVSSQLFNSFNKFNSTVAARTSSPFFVHRSLPTATRKRKLIRNSKPINNSAFLMNQSPNVNRDIKKTKDSISPPTKNKIPPDQSVNYPGFNGSNSPNKSEVNQSEVVQPKPKHNVADRKETESSGLEIPSVNSSSFAEVLTSSTFVQASDNVKNSPVQPIKRSIHQRSSSDTHKIAYVSNLHPSVTEEEVIDYLIQNNVISSTEDASCKILLSPNVDLDTVSFVSFKVTVRSELFDAVVNSKLWPSKVIAREFVNRYSVGEL